MALRNGLAAVGERLEAGDDRTDRLAFRDLRERIELELTGLEASERGRSVAWFFDVDGDSSERFVLQLPLLDDVVVWDAKPFVSPLVDIADRGAPTGIVLISGDVVRLLQIEQAEPSEPETRRWTSSWRLAPRSAGPPPAAQVAACRRPRARRATRRVSMPSATSCSPRPQPRPRSASSSSAGSASSSCPKRRSPPASAPPPPIVSERVIAESDLNLVGEEPSAIAEALEPLIDDAWLTRARALADLARERTQAGGAGAVGALETLTSLAEGRVEHLILDPSADFRAVAEMVPEAISGPGELLGERAVEVAVATGAQVTALSARRITGARRGRRDRRAAALLAGEPGTRDGLILSDAEGRARRPPR